jgi:hypothetical protein
VRRITKAAIGGFAGVALIVGGAQVASGSDVIKRLFDYQPLTDMKILPGDDAADTAFDGATASLRIMETPDGTGFKLRVSGIDTSVAGRQFGSHLHVGPCSPGVDLTGGHYQHVQGGPVTPDNEVWFDVVPNDNGVATDDTFVSFKPVDRQGYGAMSIVIHAGPTGGTRETCLPLAVGNFW